MTRHSRLFGATSVHALALFLSASALAQQSLPTIDVGGARGAARPGRSNAPRL
jgi:iron complex outermembrane receptor protein